MGTWVGVAVSVLVGVGVGVLVAVGVGVAAAVGIGVRVSVGSGVGVGLTPQATGTEERRTMPMTTSQREQETNVIN